MNISLKPASLAAAIAVLAMGASSANAALIDGTDASRNSSVFISVVERSETNQILRNLMIDTGARALDVFAGTPWSTTAAQEAEILAFVGSKSATGMIKFNVGGALTDLTYETEQQGFLTTGDSPGPASDQSGLPRWPMPWVARSTRSATPTTAPSMATACSRPTTRRIRASTPTAGVTTTTPALRRATKCCWVPTTRSSAGSSTTCQP